MLIKYNKPNIWHIGDVRLVCGMNEVDDAKWLEVSEHPLAKARIKNKVVEIVATAKDGSSVKFTNVSEKKAVQYAADCFDIMKLREWKAEEKRYKVLQAIDAQINLILSPDKKEADSE